MTKNLETVTLKVQSVRLLVKVLHLLRQDHGVNIELAQGIEDLGKVMDVCRECHDRLLEKTAMQFLQVLQAESGIDSALAFAYQQRLRRRPSVIDQTFSVKVALHSSPMPDPVSTTPKSSATTPEATKVEPPTQKSSPMPEENAAETETITLVYRGRVIKKAK